MKLTGSIKVNASEEGTKFFDTMSGMGARLLIAGFDGNATLKVEDNILKNAKLNDVYDVQIIVKRRKR